MNKPVILTGLRANNDLHIGNYFGALLPIVDMATKKSDEFQINLFVPDLHSFTTPIDHSQLQTQIMHNLRIYVAAGLPLDNANIHIYRQSYVPAHSELTWILDCFTGFGQMTRMTQFKEKTGLRELETKEEEFAKKMQELIPKITSSVSWSNEKTKIVSAEDIKDFAPFLELIGVVGAESALKSEKEKRSNAVTVGLFNYPVLMATDMLLYGAKYVPVGDDQTQHLEFARDIAERMNNRFGELFVVPEPVRTQHEFFGNDQGLRIKDLADPAKKMSKSDESGKGVIFLGDDPEAAAKKIMSATTDNVGSVHLDPEKQPGISNLLQIHALLANEPLKKVAEHHEGQTSYGDLKKEVAGQVAEFLKDFQTKLANVDEEKLLVKLKSSEDVMNKQANATLLKVQKAVGLR